MKGRRGEGRDQGGERDQEGEKDRDPQGGEEYQRQRLGKQGIGMGHYLETSVSNVKKWDIKDISVGNLKGNLRENVSNVGNLGIRNINVINQRGKSTNHCISTSRMEDIILIKKRKTSIKEKGTDLGVPVGKDF